MSKKLTIIVSLIFSNFAWSSENFIVGCKLFNTFFRTLRSTVKCHRRKLSCIFHLNHSSINLQLSWEEFLGSSTGSEFVWSKNPTDIFLGWCKFSANHSANTCLNTSSNKMTFLFLNTNSPSLKINSLLNLVGIRFLFYNVIKLCS